MSAPLGFFDPLGFYKGKNTRQKKKLRECESSGSGLCLLMAWWFAQLLEPPITLYTAEIKHGRVAMLAAVRMRVSCSNP